MNAGDWTVKFENEVADMYASHGAILAADADGMISDKLKEMQARITAFEAALRKAREALDATRFNLANAKYHPESIMMEGVTAAITKIDEVLK